ncbi:hypothetical protein [Streptomyces sp. NPDC056463]|uniref:hypothetical protein n=1 Tax=Streptomyces sp. NPDC056463 TaxID=3345827 RepID=UPI003695DC23
MISTQDWDDTQRLWDYHQMGMHFILVSPRSLSRRSIMCGECMEGFTLADYPRGDPPLCVISGR